MKIVKIKARAKGDSTFKPLYGERESRDTKSLDTILVTWEDAVHSFAKHTLDEMANFDLNKHALINRVGYFVFENDKVFIMANQYNPETKLFRDIMWIPKKNIVEVIELKQAI